MDKRIKKIYNDKQVHLLENDNIESNNTKDFDSFKDFEDEE